MKELNIELLRENIESTAMLDMEENNLFGCAYAVCQNGNLVYKKCFGSTLPDKSRAVNGDSIFRLASMTKPITAVATLILVERGLISLDDPVEKYIHEFEGVHITRVDKDGKLIDCGKTKKSITIRNLLSHTSGIGTSLGNEKPQMTDEDRVSIKNSISYYIRTGIDFEPMSMQAYSGVGAFDVMTAIIEQVTKEDYQEFLTREIFIPCGMENTTFTPTTEQCAKMMTMHNKENGKSVVGQTHEGCIFENFPQNHYLGGAGLVSTLDDYINFANMLLNQGKTGGKQIVGEEIFSLMRTPCVPEDIMPGNERWGLGVRVITGEDYPSLPVGTFGWSGAYGSHFWIDQKNKITAVFMKNSRFDGGAGNKSACRFEKAVYDSLM